MASLNNQIFAIDNIDDLREVMNACNVRFRELQLRVTAMLTVGDAVSFQTKYGETIYGTVTKVNQKTVSVRNNSSGGNWKVTASLLRKVNTDVRV